MTTKEPKKRFPGLAKKSENMPKKSRRKSDKVKYFGFFNERKSPVKSFYGIMGDMGKGGPGDAPNISSNLAPGMSGEEVRALQQWLIENGFSIPSGATGYYGNETKAAVAAWQAKSNVDTAGNPGYFGPRSMAALNLKQPTPTLPYGYTNMDELEREGERRDAGLPPASTPTPSGIPAENMPDLKNASIVQFTSDPNAGAPGDETTIWYVDHNNKAIVPFMSKQAFIDWYGPSYPTALESLNTVPQSSILLGGNLSDYTLLDISYGIYQGGIKKPIDFSLDSISKRYGNAASADLNAQAAQAIDGFVKILKNNIDTNGLNTKTINELINGENQVLLAGYIGALAYGGYSLMDIYKDLKRKELLQAGDASMAGYKVIDQNLKKRDYLKTTAGANSSAKLDTYVPGRIGSLDRAVWSSALAQMPSEFWKAAFPEYMDPESPEFKEKMEKVTSTIHDSILMSIDAKTEAEKNFADFAWQNTRDQIEKAYGIKLSDNALTAWDEVQTLLGKSVEAGIPGSGIEREALVRTLTRRRDAGKRLREQEEQDMLSKTVGYYQNNASPEEIQKLNAEDQAKGLPRNEWRSVQWGLAPAEAVSFGNFISDFRTKNPNLTGMTDAEVRAKFWDPFYDENGNRRSALYQKQADEKFQTIYGYSPGAIPGSVESSLKGYQTSIVQEQAAEEIKQGEAYKTATEQFTGSEDKTKMPESLTPKEPPVVEPTTIPKINYWLGQGEAVSAYHDRIKRETAARDKAAEAASKVGTTSGAAASLVTPTTPAQAPDTTVTPTPTTTSTPTTTPSAMDAINEQIIKGGYSSLTQSQKAIYNAR